MTLLHWDHEAYLSFYVHAKRPAGGYHPPQRLQVSVLYTHEVLMHSFPRVLPLS